jgi:hypothetical protein
MKNWLIKVALLYLLILACNNHGVNDNLYNSGNTKPADSSSNKGEFSLDSSRECGVDMVVPYLPEFPGGEDSLKVFLKDNLKSKNNGKISVGVDIYIDTNGLATSIRIDPVAQDKEIKNEVQELIKKMPRFIPGYIINSSKTYRVKKAEYFSFLIHIF